MPRTTSVFRNPAIALDAAAAGSLHLHGDGVTQPAISQTSPTIAMGNTFTVGAWVRMARPFGNAPNRETLIVVNGGTNGFQWEFGNGITGWDGSFSAFMNGSWPASVSPNPNPGVGLDSWTHCVLIKNGTSVGQNPYGAFINGVSVPISKINDNDFVDAAAQLTIGGRGGGQAFLGGCKDLFAYSRVLSQQEIQGITQRRNFPAANRLFLYPFSEGSGTTISCAFGIGPAFTRNTSLTSWSTDSPYIARTAIARRQKLRAGGSTMKVGPTGLGISIPFAANSALDIGGNQVLSVAFSMRIPPLTSNFRLFTTNVGGAFSVTLNSAGLLILQNIGGLTPAGTLKMDDRWHRYVIAYDGTTVFFYCDGVLTSSGAAAMNWTATGASTMSFLNSGLTQGFVDDWCFYKGYAWNAADAANDWYDGVLPSVAPSARWTFDERFGTTVNDVSGNGFTGTISSGTFTEEMPPWALPGTASKRYPDGFNPFAYLNGGAAYFSDLGATTSGGLISQLNDQSGNGWHMLQAAGANKPAYTAGGQGGKPFLTYGNTVPSWMATAGAFAVSDNAPGLTIYVVGSVAANSNGGDIVSRTAVAGGATYLWSIGQVGGSTGNFNSSVRNAGNTQVNNFGNTNIAPGMATTAIWSMRYDGVHNRSFTNGRPKYQDAQGQVTGNLATGASAQPLVLGDPFGGAGGTVAFYCAIVAIGAHDDDTMRWYHRYLSNYYGIPLLA